jgi:2Fe-2S ferredoxin
MEESMLEVAAAIRETSRLSCQLKVTETLDGLIVRMRASQY